MGGSCYLPDDRAEMQKEVLNVRGAESLAPKHIGGKLDPPTKMTMPPPPKPEGWIKRLAKEFMPPRK